MNVKIKFNDGHFEIHHKSPIGDGYTLCGHDDVGDEEWETGNDTKEKITCKDCNAIVKFCKKIK